MKWSESIRQQSSVLYVNKLNKCGAFLLDKVVFAKSNMHAIQNLKNGKNEKYFCPKSVVAG